MISERAFVKGVVELIRRAETVAPSDYRKALQRALRRERNEIALVQLQTMLKNLELAEKSQRPICQDTGTFTFFIRSQTPFPFDVARAIRRAIARAEREIPLRRNWVDPLTRRPLRGSDAKAEIHLEPGVPPEISVLVKGAGTENFSRLWMLHPTNGTSELTTRLVDLLQEAGGKPCPPVTLGLGIGGTSSQALVLAKHALLRRIDKPNPDPRLRKLEKSLEAKLNALGVGPMGLGGRTTVLRVLAEAAPCHTATLPVGVVLQCWPGRRGRAVIEDGQLKVIDP